MTYYKLLQKFGLIKTEVKSKPKTSKKTKGGKK